MLSEKYLSQQQYCKTEQKERVKVLKEIMSKPEIYT